jgi:hypothetical protein
MAKYKYMGEGIYDTEEELFIPTVSGNRHFDSYERWVSEGGETDPEFTAQEIEDNWWAALRTERDRLLSATDFMMSYDYYNNEMTSQEQTDVTSYRSDLRDLPGDTTYPSVTWPTKPQIVIDNVI